MSWPLTEEVLNLLQAIAAVATAVGVGLAWWQVRKSATAARTDFEDELDREYRALTRELPSEALLGKELTEPAQADALPHFLNYIDLCNQQI